MMDQQAQFIARLDSSRAKIQALLDKVEINREIYPTWTIKEILAHIAGWDDAVTAALRAILDNTQPATPATMGIDAYNAQSVEERRMLNYDQVLQEWRLSRENLKNALNALPAEKVAQDMIYPWGDTGSIGRLVEFWAAHEEEHADDLERIVNPSTSTPPAAPPSP